MGGTQTLTDIIGTLTSLALLVVPILTGLALLFFFWGIATSLFSADDKDGIKKGKERMFWGFIALFVIISLGGILVLLERTFFGRDSLHLAPRSGANQVLPTQNNTNPFGSTIPFQRPTSPQGNGAGSETP